LRKLYFILWNAESAKGLSAKGLSAKDLSAKGLSAKDLSAKDLSAKGLSAKDLSAKGLSAKGLSAKDLSAKDLSAKGLSAKDLSAKDLSAKDLSAKGLSAKGRVANRDIDIDVMKLSHMEYGRPNYPPHKKNWGQRRKIKPLRTSSLRFYLYSLYVKKSRRIIEIFPLCLHGKFYYIP
jgi:hypothetical protein